MITEKIICKKEEVNKKVIEYLKQYPVGGYDTEIKDVYDDNNSTIILMERLESCD